MVDIEKFRQLDCEIYEEFCPSEVPSGGEVAPAATEMVPFIFRHSSDWGTVFPRTRGLLSDFSANLLGVNHQTGGGVFPK